MKSWQPFIKQHIQSWSSRLGSQDWIPKHIYHFTDINNAVSILISGILYSREKANQLNLMHVDNASPLVLQQTKPEYEKFVRLYFRPKTPTLFKNEGVRPTSQLELGGAHSPIPIYFCFDSLEVLSRDETEFSDGNMGSPKSRHSREKSFFESIPFNLVFHNSAIYPEEDKNEIIHRRCAEVLVPERLKLDESLKMIVCRSQADIQTLSYLLPYQVYSQWQKRIRIGDKGFYFRKWTFVEEVVTVDDKVVFRFNPDTITPGPFNVKFSYCEYEDKKLRIWEGVVNEMKNTWTIRVQSANYGEISLYLDGSLVYKGLIIFNEIPF